MTMSKLNIFSKSLIEFLACEATPLLLTSKTKHHHFDTTILDQLKKDGVVAIPNFYTQDHCDTIIKEIDHIIETYKETIQISPDHSDFRAFCANKVSPVIQNFFTDPFISEGFCAYFGTTRESLIGCTLAARLSATQNNLGSGGGWHRDLVFYKQFKGILYLTDVDTAHGPFQYILGSHTEWSKLKAYLKTPIKFHQPRLTHEEVESISKHLNSPIKEFTAKAGTLLLADTSGVHRGAPIQEGTRYALTNYYTPRLRFKKNFLKNVFDLDITTPKKN